ncbi:unnamed protein product, partial [Thelazia callipaeda]|uniref:Uncharacterized protein n=1 Tax=Thelazia callipaeda TaxID=103827 RepID=A0A0N5D7W8_THECL
MSSSPVHDSSRSEFDNSDIQIISVITADTRRRARTPEVIVIDSDDDMNTAEIIQATRVHWPHMPPKRMRRMDSEENHASQDMVHMVGNNEVEKTNEDSDIEILDMDQSSEAGVVSMDLDTEILEGSINMDISSDDFEEVKKRKNEENEDSNDDDVEDGNMIDVSDINNEWMSGDEEMYKSNDSETMERAPLRDGQVTEEILSRNDGDLGGNNPSSSSVVETRDKDVPSSA